MKKKTTSMKTTKMTTSSKLTIEHRGPSIFEIAHHVHHTFSRSCAYCGRLMTPSDVNDYGTLCERCYPKEYYND